ncbi:Gfo/Idh/MocA family protein [Chryseolinea lacunae]|uniref:Gfo/Idh/MocA family oxidoreductase n=1 Tax=Chryseolinea lacunae TaxID=2801331 RepID=A0ABS1KR57_9BACT|nr:Gfo/Idh/MocA family oxidoreductase [Chryseolinea lacunae]MBL0741960.1 Gfo/Idh/MocA family oxidoreductase [Chryseolinea lacunae]
MNKINWGIIGCGDVCEVKSGPAFNKVNNSSLVAVMRRDADKAKDYAARHHVPKFYSDASQLINDSEVNAIYVATPPSTHEQYVEEALKAGKPVYVEKPVTINSASCARMIALAKKYNNKVSVAHYRRALPLFTTVKNLLEKNVIGKIRFVRISVLQQPKQKYTNTQEPWRLDPSLSGGGLFHDLSPHQLDILYWLFGEPVSSSGRSFNQAGLYNAPDVTTIDASFRNDILFQGIWAFNVAENSREDVCEIVGEKGKLRFSFFINSDLHVVTDKGTDTVAMNFPVNIQLPMIESVTKYFRGEGPNPCSLDEALVTLRMMDKTLS